MFIRDILNSLTILFDFTFLIYVYTSEEDLLVVVIDDCFSNLGHEGKYNTIFVLFDVKSSLGGKVWKKFIENRFSIAYQMLFGTIWINSRLWKFVQYIILIDLFLWLDKWLWIIVTFVWSWCRMRYHFITIVWFSLSLSFNVRIEFFIVFIYNRQQIKLFEMKFNRNLLIVARWRLKELSFSWLLLLRINSISMRTDSFLFLFILAKVNDWFILFLTFFFSFSKCFLMSLVC